MIQRILSFFALLIALLIAGCGGAPTVSGDRDGDNTPREKPLVRPVVAPERGGDELMVAISLIKDGNFRQAEVNLEEIIKVRPDLAEAHFNLGWSLYQLKKYTAAIAAIKGGLQVRPSDVRAMNLLAICERSLGKFADAEKTYRQALALAPDDERLHFNLGILYDLYLFQAQPALEHYRRYQALQKTPDARVAGWITLLERKESK